MPPPATRDHAHATAVSIFLPFPNVTADTRVLMSGLTEVELLDAGKK